MPIKTPAVYKWLDLNLNYNTYYAKTYTQFFSTLPLRHESPYGFSLCTSGYELRDILLKDKPLSLFKYSPNATVPVLVLPEKVIDESLEIMTRALQQQDPDG
jgi:hypothetical protein